MTTTRARIKALEATTAGPLPILILKYEGQYSTAGDGLYYGPDDVKYSPDEVEKLCDHNTVIVLEWSDDWKKDREV